jgi:hypothetical protein
MLTNVRARISANRADVLFVAAVAATYAAIAIVAFAISHQGPDRMMVLARRIFDGRLDDPSFQGTVDSVALGGQFYIAVGPMQVLPYLPFVPFQVAWPAAAFLVDAIIGGAAAVLALPLARAYGAVGTVAYWIAAFTAFGTLLVYVSVEGDFYYLAQAESFLLLELFLLEWAGPRRSVLLGLCLGLSFLARPTTILAVVPFGLVLLWQSRRRVMDAMTFGLPIAASGVAYAAFNVARFGSALESGYSISELHSALLVARRASGLFALGHLPENIKLAFLALPRLATTPPYIVPHATGLSMLLVSPGLVTAVRAGFRGLDRLVLWAAAFLVGIPAFLYYGGGVVQYGFRYSLDATPFLVALIAIGSRSGFGRVDRVLFVLSAASVFYGVLWRAHVFGAFS